MPKRRDTSLEAAARWAVIELAMKLKLLTLEMDEFDVSGRMVGLKKDETPPYNVHTFSYVATPIGFWIHLVEQGGKWFPISAMVRDGTKPNEGFRYYGFVYSAKLEYRRIERANEPSDKLWMVIVGR